MDADELIRALAGLGQHRDRQGRGVGGIDAVGANGGFDAGGDLGFDLGVFKHRFDDQIAAGKGCVIGGGGDAGQHLGLFLGRDFAPCDAFVEQGFRMRTATVGGGLIGVDQHHRNARIGRNIGDASPHHACADHPQFLHRLIGDSGAVRAFFQRLFVDEEAADHRRRRGVHQHRGELARLDLKRGVKGHQRAFVDGGKQGAGGGIDAHGFAQHHRRGAHKGHKACGVIGRAAGHFIALGVPWFHQLGVGGGQNPGLGAGKQVFGGHDFVDQASGAGGFWIRELAFQQIGRSHHRAQFARKPGGAACARKDADHDFGQADFGAGVIGGDDAVAGQWQFEPDAKRCARQGRDNRLAALKGLLVHPRAFNLAQHAVHPHHAVENRLGPACAHLGDDVQIHAAGEILFRRGDDDAAGLWVGQGAINHLRQLQKAGGRHHIHRLGHNIPSQGDNAVGVHGIGEIGHRAVPLTKGIKQVGAGFAPPKACHRHEDSDAKRRLFG